MEESSLLGVVEGFYNRPWSESQRLDLFKKLKSYGCNSYVYAPKDDARHRTRWRDPEDLGCLKVLLEAASTEGIRFFYGISPGLDISYSSEEDVNVLKNKLDRVLDLGCKGFALLWDDIDKVLPQCDRKTFSSLGEAHAEVSNRIYAHLASHDVEFLVCPLEYSSSRAEPDLLRSEYLRVFGKELRSEAMVFWTGSRIVSETITLEEILQVGQVLKRKPVIWDNLHANDYDCQRLYLGPYFGRSPDIIPHINGVLTNPNCQYSANVPAIYTLSKWASLGKEYDPFKAAEDSIPEFLKELYRPTQSDVDEDYPLKKSMTLTNVDIDLLMQALWLPYSHGPKMEWLCKEFEYLRDHAHITREFVACEALSDVEADENEPDRQDTFIWDWISRASALNDVCNAFSQLVEKLPFISNRELFFDINSLLNGIHVALMACNRYLKWVGLHQCARPLKRGPLSSGLPGGLAGDLMRLYPVQSVSEFPVYLAPAFLDKKTIFIRPVINKEIRNLCKKFSHDSLMEDFLSDQQSITAYVSTLNSDPYGLVMVSTYPSHIRQSLKTSKKFSWELEEDYPILALFVVNKLLFTETLDLMLETVIDSLKFKENDNPSLIAILHKHSKLSRQYLMRKEFSPISDDSIGKFVVLKR